MHELQQTFRQTIANGLRRATITSPSKWAEEYRMMGPPIPGKWRFDYHPWLKEIHDSKQKQIVILKAAQMGFTETVLNITFYNIDVLRKDCLYVLPSKTPDASDFSSSRFDAALELSTHLSNLFSDVKNVGHKRAGSANLYIRGSNSRSGLKSIPASLIVFDELDEMNEDNVILGEERAGGQFDWQIIKLSTPTAFGVGVDKVYAFSTQEHFFFPCPHCDKSIELKFPESLIITGDDALDPKVKDSYLICTECQGKLEHENKKFFLKNGVWVPTGPKHLDIRGFHIPQLYSSADRASPWRLAVHYLESLTDVAKEEEFYNSKLGRAHIPKGAQVTDDELTKARERSRRNSNDSRPDDIKIITMGADVNMPFINYVVCGWKFPRYTNDLNMSAECEVLKADEVISFKELAQLMKNWQVQMCVIDAQPERRLSYEFACNFWGYVKIHFFTSNHAGRSITVDANEESHIVTTDRTSWLDVTLNRFHNQTITIPRDTTIKYNNNVKALIRRYKEDKNGHPVGTYISSGQDHFGLAQCYAEIALPLAASKVTNSDIKAFL